MDEVGQVPIGSALQAQLAVGGHGIVHEHDCVGKPPIVQDLPVGLAQLATLGLKPELVLKLEIKLNFR